MPRKTAAELQSEEQAAASPLRRSTRTTAGRRLSTDSESSIPQKVTRSRRASQDEIAPTEAKPATRLRRGKKHNLNAKPAVKYLYYSLLAVRREGVVRQRREETHATSNCQKRAGNRHKTRNSPSLFRLVRNGRSKSFSDHPETQNLHRFGREERFEGGGAC